MRSQQERFGLHPLAVEECRQPAQRAKVDEYDNHLLIVAQLITRRHGHDRPLHFTPLDAFLTRDCLITLHRGPVPALDAVWKRFSLGAVPGQRSAAFLYYLLIDALVDDVFPIIDELSDQIETLEAEIIRNFKGNELRLLLRMRRQLTSMRRILAPERDMLAVLLRHGDPRFDEQTSVYFRDVYDHLVRAFEQLEVERDLLSNATEAYHSGLANRTNDIMKQLTIFASIFRSPSSPDSSAKISARCLLLRGCFSICNSSCCSGCPRKCRIGFVARAGFRLSDASNFGERSFPSPWAGSGFAP
jgi:magnesium transporter